MPVRPMTERSKKTPRPLHKDDVRNPRIAAGTTQIPPSRSCAYTERHRHHYVTHVQDGTQLDQCACTKYCGIACTHRVVLTKSHIHVCIHLYIRIQKGIYVQRPCTKIKTCTNIALTYSRLYIYIYMYENAWM